MGVTCPIMVLKANHTIVASNTPLARVAVLKISAGMIHDMVPGALFIVSMTLEHVLSSVLTKSRS